MNPDNICVIAQRRLAADKTGEFRFIESGGDCGEPRGRLGMAMAWIMAHAIGMRHKQCRHGVNPSLIRTG